eukprot:3314975-Amphidinium_carterae.1
MEQQKLGTSAIENGHKSCQLRVPPDQTKKAYTSAETAVTVERYVWRWYLCNWLASASNFQLIPIARKEMAMLVQIALLLGMAAAAEDGLAMRPPM